MKQDYLRECLSEISSKLKRVVPMDGFQREFCTYCQNKECGRSGASNMSFDRRANNWYSDLFLNVPRANENDEISKKLSAIWTPPNFKPEPQVVMSDSMSENFPDVHTNSSDDSIQEPSDEPLKNETKNSDDEQKTTAIQESGSIQEMPDVPVKVPVKRNFTNTPFDSPSYVGSQNQSKEVTISPGGTFTFGDD